MSVAGDIGRTEALLGASIRIPEGVVYRGFVKETVILNLETGLYHGVNPTGGRMLEVLESTGSVRRAAANLASEYDKPVAEIEVDLCEFCDALAQRGLITIEPA